MSIAQMMRIIVMYPTHLSNEKNIFLMEAISLEELRKEVKPLQKDKITGSDGWSVEFVLVFMDVFELDLQKFIK